MPHTTTDVTPDSPGVRRGVAPARRVSAVALALVGLPVGTVLLLGVRGDLGLGSFLLLYLLAVVVVAAVGGLVPGILAAGLSFGLANWFFTPPYHTLAVDSRDSLVELVVFAVAAAVVSALVELAARDRAAHQHQLAQQEARTRELAAVDRVRAALLAAVGHDLRTPLANVKAAVSSLRQEDVEWAAAEEAELLATIEQSTDRLTSLVTNLLDMTRLRSDALTVRPSAVALDEVVARAVLTQDADVVVVDIADDLPLVLADPALLERVVENLVQNAVRFSPPGATVEVTAGPGVGGAAPTIDGESPPAAALQVIDHGPGIPAERREDVFAAFQRLDDRTSGSNVGLGLAIAQGFTEAMGGRISPSTTPGGGLTMTVTLPVAVPSTAP